ncbi:hypothetical protein GIB67_009220 [Kingdonia uniflora]|uniref:Terpene synthase N-terminal domain-containing protein n=1 Tax=Kingdonia uniflora TaxID=39325 RepID=A0A7J7N2H0_9MAGN|nr:hypothetical protein GIB67_009220 [Kingdonia uniflora]
MHFSAILEETLKYNFSKYNANLIPLCQFGDKQIDVRSVTSVRDVDIPPVGSSTDLWRGEFDEGGLVFPSVIHFKDALAHYEVAFKMSTDKAVNNSKRVKAYCMAKNYNWHTFVSKIRNSALFQVHACDFTHGVHSLTQAYRPTIMSCSVSKTIHPKVKDSLNYALIDITQDINMLENTRLFNDQAEQVEELKEEVRKVLMDVATTPIHKLNLIDKVIRLGVGYHFEMEIEKELEQLNNAQFLNHNDDLYSSSLHFRLLRHHGSDVMFLALFLLRYLDIT